MNSTNNDINPAILFLFSFIDVIMYGVNIPVIQLPFTIAAYLFILFEFLKNQKKGILYFISFNILTIGIGNYWGDDNAKFSYWGLRIGPFSANILFSAILVVLVCVKKRFKHLLPGDSYSLFLLVLIVWTGIVGSFMFLSGINYKDNYISDILIFTPVIFYMIICKDLKLIDLMSLIKYFIPITIYSLLFAFILDKRMSYSSESFIISNAFVCTFPFSVIILRRYLTVKYQFIYLFILLFLYSTIAMMIGGKTIIGFILLIIWTASLNKKWRFVNLTLIFLGIPLLALALEQFVNLFSNSGIIAFKFGQVLSLVSNPNFFELAGEMSSVGNIIAEGITMTVHLFHNLPYLIFGKGFGGGIPDIYGFLTPFAGASGYSEIDATRNNFFNLHIAPWKILINGGIIIFLYYLKILYSILSLKTAMSFLTFLMMIFFFYVSKEFFLLSYIMLRICYLANNSKTIKASNISNK